MATIRRKDFFATIALGCTLLFATQSFGQTIINSVPLNRFENVQPVTVTVQAAPRQHLGNGPIDMNNLSPDILNCDVCRQRLGLPPLNSAINSANSSSTSGLKPIISPAKTIPGTANAPMASSLNQLQVNQLPSGRMLGSPGMITSATAEQMAMNGMVVEEFKPPQPEQNAIQLGALPPEVRQEFVRGLGLPPGARIMSAAIKGQNEGSGTQPETIVAKDSETNPESASSQMPKSDTLGANGIVSPTEETSLLAAESIVAVVQKTNPPTAGTLAPPVSSVQATSTKSEVDFSSERNELKQTIEKLQKQLEDQESAFEAKKNQIEADVSAKKQAIGEMHQQLEQKAIKLNSQLELFQSESKKRLEQTEAASKEALAMLEKRTAEVTELQLQLKEKQEAIVKTEQELVSVKEALAKASSATEKHSSSGKPESKKKQQNKGKKENPIL